MKKILFTLLIMLAAVTVRAQEDLDFIQDAIQNLDAPMYGVTGGPRGNGNGVVGAIGGTVSVGGLGAANYCIPIDLPSGIGNMKPSLSINYNSQSSNGLLGWGWTLGGVSAITRVGCNLFDDGKIKGVDFNDDNYALDGQRLFVVNDSPDGTEYRTEVDGMSRIVSYDEPGVVNGPAKFKVWTADGLIMEYGFSDSEYNSRVQWDSETDATKKEVGMWLLNRVEDRNGNYMEYQYVIGEHNYCLSKVFYAGNGNARLDPAYCVKFIYKEESRKDKEVTYIGNHALNQSQLLDSIIIKHWTEKIAGYTFTYHGVGDNASGYPYDRLESINYFAGNVRYNPTRINWDINDYNNADRDYKVDYSTDNGKAFNDRVKYTGDFNGDGYQDVMIIYKESRRRYAEVYLNDGAYNEAQGTCSFSFLQKLELPVHTESIHIADLNGDGRDDMATVSKTSYDLFNNKIEIFTYLAKWNTDNQWRLDYTERDWAGETFKINQGHQANLMVGDFLGNGKTELIMQIPEAAGSFVTNPLFLYIYQTGENLFKLERRELSILPGKRFVAADFNGDGITEIWCDDGGADSGAKDETAPERSTNGALYRMSAMFTAQKISHDYMLCSSHNIMLGDFNGDGRQDFLSYRKTSGRYEWKINYFKEDALAWNAFDITSQMPVNDLENESYDIFDAPSRHKKYKFVEVNDMDGDGKSDLVVENNGKLHVLYGPVIRINDNDARFSHVKVYDMRSIGLCRADGTLNNMSLRCGNFLGRENMGIIGDLNVFSVKPMTNRYSVQSIEDGMGNVSVFSYDYLTSHDSDFYKWSRYWDEPDFDIYAKPFQMKALAQVTSYNEVADTPKSSTKYYYRNALVHKNGKGVMGFRSTITENYVNGTRIDSTTSNYTIEPLKAHRALALESQSTYNGLNRLASKNVFFNSFVERHGDSGHHIYIPVVTKTYAYAYDPDRGESAMLSKSITENSYRIDFVGGNDGLGYYQDFLKLPDTYTGMTDHGWPETVTQCTYQTHTHTAYGVENETLLANWIINRPDTTTVTAMKLGETFLSESVITYKYYSSNSYLPLKVTSYPGGDLANANGLATSTSFKYDVAGNVTSDTLTALNGCQPSRTTSYAYDNFRFRTAESNAMGYVAASGFDARYGEIKWSEDCNGQRTDFNRSDHLGTSEWVRYPDMTYGCTAMRWARNRQGFYDEDAPDKATYYSWKRISGEAPVKVFYDAAGRELRSVSMGLNGRVIYQDTDYNAMGLVSQKSLPYFKDETAVWTSYGYDGLMRQTDTYMPDGNRLHTDYDGLTTASTLHTYEGRERTTSQTANYLGQVVKSVDAMGTEVTYGYYPDGKLEWTQAGSDSRTRINLEYDDAGNRTVVHDPNYGMLLDEYDAFGQIKYTTTPKGNVTTYKYDALGRVTGRIETDNELHLDEITKWTYCNSGRQKGLLMNVSIDRKQSITYKYDEQHLNRLIGTEEMLLGESYQTSYTYDDAAGFPLRVKSVTYPTGYVTANVYEDGTGLLRRIEDQGGNLLWETLESSALGQVKACTLGNGDTTRYDYYRATARLQSIYSYLPQNILQDLSYEYDDFGNLAARTDNAKNLREEFRYDDLDRLDTILLNQVVTGVMTYDNLGRMTSKSADGQPVFRAAHYGYTGQDGQYRPHAVSEARVEGNPFCATSQTVEYTMFDKVRTLIQGKNSIDYTYGYDHERIRMLEFDDNGWRRTKTYVGNCEYYDDPNGHHSLTHLVGPMGVFAVAEQIGDNPAFCVHYIHKDHLGSWVAQTDAWGNIEEESSYDAWGNRRDPYTWTGSVVQLPMFDRGFTGHEHLFSFGLINMNGRMYDPVMSSFLSVDSYVQSPDNSQNFNRYAYCLNNPLKYTDPDGECAILTAVVVGALVSAGSQMISNVIHEQELFNGVGRAAITGAIQGAFSFGIGQVAGAIGKAAAKAAGNAVVGKICQAGFQVVAHGTLGGCSTYARGGEFGVGFASGAVSSAISSLATGICEVKINSKGWTAAITIAAGGLSGGITSTIAGGDFWDGVCNGLISSGLNHAMHLVAEGVLPDDPPGANKEQDNTQSAIATVSGIDTGVDAALEFSSFVKTNPEFAKIWFSVEKFAKGIGITCSLTNFGVSFYRAFTGQISWNVFALQTGVSLVELGLNAIPVAGPVLSTALTSFDAGGGFDNTLYNDVWINDHSGPMPGFLNVRFGAEYNYRDFGKQLF